MGQTTLNQMKQVKTSAILIGAPRCSWDRAVNWLHPLSLLQLCVSCLVKLSCKNNIFLLVLCTLFFYSVSVSLFRWTWWKYNPVNGLLYCFINAIGYCQIPAMWWHHPPGVSEARLIFLLYSRKMTESVPCLIYATTITGKQVFEADQ